MCWMAISRTGFRSLPLSTVSFCIPTWAGLWMISAPTLSPFASPLGFDAIVRIYCQEVDEWQTDEWRLSTEISNRDGMERRIKTIETPGENCGKSWLCSRLSPACTRPAPRSTW